MSIKMNYMDGFGLCYERFLVACDALEETGAWPVAKLGEMEAWLANDMSCIIMSLITSDGRINRRELDCLNEAMGVDYSAEELESFYANSGGQIDSFLETALPDDIRVLEQLNPVLASEFRQMLSMIAKLVIESDDEVVFKEKETAKKLLSLAQ